MFHSCGDRGGVGVERFNSLKGPPGALAYISFSALSQNASYKLQIKMIKFVVLVLLLNWNVLISFQKQVAWGKPGCHKIGHTNKVSIPDCVEFYVTTNACRGYCESFALPSPPGIVKNNPHQPITSVGQCCSMMDTEDVEVTVYCLDGTRDLTFKSAKTCSCYHCKKD